MLQHTNINCPACTGKLVADLERKSFVCQKCFISYKDNEKMTRFLATQPVKIVKISEGETYENQKASSGTS